MRRIAEVLAMICLLLLVSCERRPLVDISNTHYVRVYVDEGLLNVTKGFYDEDNERPEYYSPEILRVILADPQTGAVKEERFFRNKGEDEEGTYFEGYVVAAPGKYHLLAYNFDTQSLTTSDINNCHQISANSIEIAQYLKRKIPSRAKQNQENLKGEGGVEKIVYGPDHLFSAHCEEVNVYYQDEIDTLRTAEGKHFRAESIVKSYYLQVKVQGMKFVSSSVGVLTGMAGSAAINGSGMNENDPATLYFDMIPGKQDAENEDVSVIYTTFSTFGKLPESDNELEITFDFLTHYGEPYSETLNITDLFRSKDAIEHQWLLIDHTIAVPEPPPIQGGGGGLTPGVGDYEDVETDIFI